MIGLLMAGVKYCNPLFDITGHRIVRIYIAMQYCSLLRYFLSVEVHMGSYVRYGFEWLAL